MLVLMLLLTMLMLLLAVVDRFDWIAMREQPFQRIAIIGGMVLLAAAVYAVMLVVAGIRPSQFVRRERS